MSTFKEKLETAWGAVKKGLSKVGEFAVKLGESAAYEIHKSCKRNAKQKHRCEYYSLGYIHHLYLRFRFFARRMLYSSTILSPAVPSMVAS